MSRQNKEKQGAKETKTSVTVLMGCTAFLSTDFFMPTPLVVLELACHIQNVSNLYLKVSLY